MIGLALVADQPPAISAVAPEEFRRKVALHHMCFTETATDSGYKEVALLYLERGENLADVALAKTAGQPPMFERGLVTGVQAEKEDTVTRLVAALEGQRRGRPAQMKITLTMKQGDGMAVAAALSQDDQEIRFSCFPDVRGEGR